MPYIEDPIGRRQTAYWTFHVKGDNSYTTPALATLLDGTFVPGKLANLGTGAAVNQEVVSPLLRTSRQAATGAEELIISADVTRTAGAGTISSIVLTPLVNLDGADYHTALANVTLSPTTSDGATKQSGVATSNTGAWPEVKLALGTITLSGTSSASEFDVTIYITE